MNSVKFNSIISCDDFVELLRAVIVLGSYKDHCQGADEYARDSKEYKLLLKFFMDVLRWLN